MRGSWRLNKDFNILTSPAPPDIAVCRSRSPDAQPEARSSLCWLSLLHLITNWSGPQTPSGVLRAPSARCGFHYHILSLTHLISNLMTSNSIGGPEGPFSLVWLSLPHLVSNSVYFLSSPSYIIVQSPTQSLEWHVWSSSCSSEVTLFRCISLWVYHGFLPCPISSAKSANAISFDYWPLGCVTSFRCITLKWHVWPGRRSIYNI